MEVVAKMLAFAICATALLFGVYIGVRTAIDPVWFVRWLNRVNPVKHPSELRKYWWVQWKLMARDPDVVRESPLLFWEYRIGGLLFAFFCTWYLLGLVAYAASR